MSQLTPFQLRVFVVDGDPDGLRIAERSNWIGKAVIFPRSLFPRIKSRDEFKQTGIYLLLGPRDDGEGEKLYIGEADPIGPRLENHFAYKDFWTRGVFFMAGMGQLNKAHVQYLEARLVQLARAAKRVPLENGNDPGEPTLSEADRAVMEVFLSNMLSMLPILGIHAFENAAQATPISGAGQNVIQLMCRGRQVAAIGYETTQGFLVKAGSTAVSEQNEAPSLAVHVKSVFKARRDLIANGVLQSKGDLLNFGEDYTFNSPSLAAAVVLGCSANGRTAWKASDGTTLKGTSRTCRWRSQLAWNGLN